MDKERNLASDTDQKKLKDKSQIINTSGGEMPDPNQKKKTPQEEEVESTFRDSNAKGNFKK